MNSILPLLLELRKSILVALAASLALCGPSSAQVRGKTLRMTGEWKVCNNTNGVCKTGRLNYNVYFAANGQVFDYADNNQGDVLDSRKGKRLQLRGNKIYNFLPNFTEEITVSGSTCNSVWTSQNPVLVYTATISSCNLSEGRIER